MSIPLSNLDSVLTSTDKAKGLPNEHYVSEAVFDEEKKAILFTIGQLLAPAMIYLIQAI